jgi:hypothetical protein
MQSFNLSQHSRQWHLSRALYIEIWPNDLLAFPHAVAKAQALLANSMQVVRIGAQRARSHVLLGRISGFGNAAGSLIPSNASNLMDCKSSSFAGNVLKGIFAANVAFSLET